MRVTLDIDDDVLQAAEAIATAESMTAGQLISDVVRRSLLVGEKCRGEGTMMKNGWLVLSGRTESSIAAGAVARLIDEDEDEQARRAAQVATGAPEAP